MNKKPVYYMQTDGRWKGQDYSAPGEKRTIGTSGCGPACAAMLIAAMRDAAVTPAVTAAWSKARGYKAKGQGTYYSYFEPQFAAYGIEAQQLSGVSVYHKPESPVHDNAFRLLRDGYYLIACMGPGDWTSSGHFVVVWWADDRVRILDPASNTAARAGGDPAVFRAQVKYYWAVDAREHNREEDKMDQEGFNQMMAVYLAGRNGGQADAWAAEAWEKARAAGIFDGTAPRGFITRQQAAVVLDRLGLADPDDRREADQE